MTLLSFCLATALAAAPEAPHDATLVAALATDPPAGGERVAALTSPLAISPAAAGAPRTPAVAAVEAPQRLKLLGLMASAGAPDGGVVSLVARPVKWVRADAGWAYNYFNQGAQAGLTLVPFHWAIVPTLRGEVGRFFRSDVNAKARRFGNVPTYMEPFLGNVGYDYASVQLGLEVGSQRSFLFFVRGGLAWLKGSLGDGTVQDSSTSGAQVSIHGLTVRASGPTASLGFLFYVW